VPKKAQWLFLALLEKFVRKGFEGVYVPVYTRFIIEWVCRFKIDLSGFLFLF
jgi:hypothetical protein